MIRSGSKAPLCLTSIDTKMPQIRMRHRKRGRRESLRGKNLRMRINNIVCRGGFLTTKTWVSSAQSATDASEREEPEFDLAICSTGSSSEHTRLAPLHDLPEYYKLVSR
mmetsp:Transcript_31066/g.49873  ORF Transcript_31066/g.49873 Transcript_31066/m.49873 type:complete len:109 (-) Transcript_31066:68-394(-)